MHSMRAIPLDLGVTWGCKIVGFDTDLANALSSYMTPEDDINSNLEKPLWRYSLFCNALKASLLTLFCESESQMQS